MDTGNRTYKKRLIASRVGMLPEQIAQAKNARCRERNAARKIERRGRAEALLAERAGRSDAEQLHKLDRGGFVAKRERARLSKSMAA